jgi:hypothetical protein
VSITVAEVAEAEVMADAGLDEILIAYPIVGEARVAFLYLDAFGSRSPGTRDRRGYGQIVGHAEIFVEDLPEEQSRRGPRVG